MRGTQILKVTTDFLAQGMRNTQHLRKGKGAGGACMWERRVFRFAQISLRNKMSTQIRVSAQHWIEMGLEFGNQSNSCKDVSFTYKSLAQQCHTKS